MAAHALHPDGTTEDDPAPGRALTLEEATAALLQAAESPEERQVILGVIGTIADRRGPDLDVLTTRWLRATAPATREDASIMEGTHPVARSRAVSSQNVITGVKEDRGLPNSMEGAPIPRGSVIAARELEPEQQPHRKLSVSLPAALDEELRERAGAGGISPYIAAAVRRQLERDRLGDLLGWLDEEYGPVPEDAMARAEEEWPRAAQ
jgi:hypothetical protein